MNELQAGIELALMVLGQSAVLLQPGKAAFHHPALGHDLEGVQLAAPGNLHGDMLAQRFTHAPRKRLSRVATVGQHALHLMQVWRAPLECLQGSLAVCHIRCRHRYRVWQPLSVYSNVALDPRDLLARVIALQARRVRVLDTLRVADQERA